MSTLPSSKSDPYSPTKDIASFTIGVSSAPSIQIDIVILTVKEAEFRAVFELLEPLTGHSKILRYLFESNIYYFGRYGLYDVALLSCHDAGMSNAMNSLGDALKAFAPRPQLAVNIGIAWGAYPDKVKLGDVLIADKVINADDIKLTPDQTIDRSPVPSINDRSKAMVHTCKLLWKFQNLDGTSCQAHVGLYVGSNTLLNNKDKKKEILGRCPEAIGGEMESYAIFAAASRVNVPWMVIKGISDWGDGTKNDQYHKVATASAASFLHTICTEIPNLVEKKV